MKKRILALVVLAFVLTIAGPALAVDAAQDQRAETKSLRKEIVKLKYVRAQDIYRILQSYVSLDGYIRFQNEMPYLLTIGETSENVDKILAVIREIDTKPADVLFTVQLILGSETDAQTDAELQNDPIIKELRKLLRYKGYTLLDSTLVRVINRERASVVLGPKAEFEFALQPDVAGDAKAPVIKTEVMLRQVIRAAIQESATMKAAQAIVTTLIQSTLNIKSGDRTVVGVSKLDGGDKGLILIISGKIVD